MSRPVSFMADTKKDDAASSIDPSPGTEEKAADAAAITLETLPTFPRQGSVVSSACLTPPELERPRSDLPYWNGNGVAHPEVEEGDVHHDDAPIPVPAPVPRRQGLPSFAQSEFYTVDTISVHTSASPGLLIFIYLFSYLFLLPPPPPFCCCIDCASSTS